MKMAIVTGEVYKTQKNGMISGFHGPQLLQGYFMAGYRDCAGFLST